MFPDSHVAKPHRTVCQARRDVLVSVAVATATEPQPAPGQEPIATPRFRASSLDVPQIAQALLDLCVCLHGSALLQPHQRDIV